jgi:hypothetical protein
MLWKRSQKVGTLLLAAWLVVTGLLQLLDIVSPVLHNLNAILAVAAGVFVFLDR